MSFQKPPFNAVRTAIAICACAVLACAAFAQEALPADLERQIRDGALDALSTRFSAGRNARECGWIARAAANKAAKTREDKSRQAAFEEAEKRFQRWIDMAARDDDLEPERRVVDAAIARTGFGDMVMSSWLGPQLDEYELSAGRRGDIKAMLILLAKAEKSYERAQRELEPLWRQLDAGGVEDRFLSLGIFDTLRKLKIDLNFNFAWASYYTGAIGGEGERGGSLLAAERNFRELINNGQPGEAGARCNLGLAMSLRAQRRFDEALKTFDAAAVDASPPLLAQIRYEKARCQIAAERFEEARLTLGPLVEKDAGKLPEAEQPARFYYNLAEIWDANSYLVESDFLRQQALGSSAAEALTRRAQRARETGLAKMNELALRGGPWPALVQLYVISGIPSGADLSTLQPAELLFAARKLIDEKKYPLALLRLREAAGRKDVAPRLMGDVLYQIGFCEHEGRDLRAAAEAFARLADEYPAYERSPQAATYAYQLWATIAEESKQPRDYLRLADALHVLIERYPRHEKRDEALWWLPVALQAAGQYEAAGKQFANVSPASIRWEEAQYRRVMCLRQSLTASASAPAQGLDAQRIVAELVRYAREARGRAGQARDPAEVQRWSATALLTAGELSAQSSDAGARQTLELLSGFEKTYPESDLIGRVLAARINAHRRLRQFDQAGAVVRQYLESVPAEQAGGVLASVAAGMLDEAERLESEGQSEAARKLAREALPTFEQLDAWTAADAARAAQREAVSYGLARMTFLSGDAQRATSLGRALLDAHPQNGAYQRLYALALSAPLGLLDPAAAAAPDTQKVAAAREAWQALLRDPHLRTTQPERFWEARYYFLALMLAEGRATEVEKAIRQERVWYPELGGPLWRGRFDRLHTAAASAGAAAPAPSSQP